MPSSNSNRYRSSDPSGSVSMTSMDMDMDMNAPPPPPPRRSKSKGSTSKGRSRDSHSHSLSGDRDRDRQQPQSRYEDENDSHNSRDRDRDRERGRDRTSSRTKTSTSKSTSKSKSKSTTHLRASPKRSSPQRHKSSPNTRTNTNTNHNHHLDDQSTGGQSNASSHFSGAAPPPPPPGQPPSQSRRKVRGGSGSVNGSVVSEKSMGSNSNSNSKGKKGGLGRISESKESKFDGREDGSPTSKSSRRDRGGRDRDRDRDRDRHDDNSVDTEVLRYGDDGDSTVHSHSVSRESVADRRRKKAQAKSKEAKSSPSPSPSPSPVKKGNSQKRDTKTKTERFEDPPLELYSDSDSDDSDYDERAAMNKSKDKGSSNSVGTPKKGAGINRVKELIQKGKSSPEKPVSRTTASSSSSPEKASNGNDRNGSPNQRSGKKTVVQQKKQKDEKNLSPTQRTGRKTTVSPARKSKSKSPDKKKKKKGGILSRFSPGRKRATTPEQNRGRQKASPERSTSKRGASPFRFRSKSRDNNGKGKNGKRDNQNRIKKYSDHSNSAEITVDREKLAKTERKLNAAADARRELSGEVEDHLSRGSASAAKSKKHQRDDNKSLKSNDRSAISSVSEKKESTFEKLRREREEKRARENKNSVSERDSIEGSDIISNSNSDDVSEMTDPTYATKRDERKKSPKRRNLDPVEETETSPSRNRNTSKNQWGADADEEDSYEEGSLRSKSPTSKGSKSTRDSGGRGSPFSKASKSRMSSKSTRGRDHERSFDENSFESKGRSGSPTSKGSKSRHSKNSKSEINGDGWNPETFSGTENFVATIDPFTKATKASKDPFDDPFYPSASNNDEPKQVYSFVYSEDDTELDRGGFSKDTMTGLSFDSADDDDTKKDNLSYATPSGQSEITEVVQNTSNRQMLPPHEKPNSVRNAFLGIDEDSGAVTLNVSQNRSKASGWKEESSPRMGSLSQRALNRPKKSRGFLDDDGDAEVRDIDRRARYYSPRNSAADYSQKLDTGVYQSRSKSRSPEPGHRSPSFILNRRDEHKSRRSEKHDEKQRSISPKQRFGMVRGKGDPIVAQERGRRREKIFEKSPKSKRQTSVRTYSPDKMKAALSYGYERNSSPTRVLARSAIRSPTHGFDRVSHEIAEEDSWFEKPTYNTLHIRSPPSSTKSKSSTRSVFKAPQVFFGSPREAPFKAHEVYDRRTDPVLASVAHIEDPIQRAGAMILSAAAIPIQAEMRKYLGIRHRENRTWAIVVVQAYFRRWKAELARYKYLYCITRIQAAFRGWLVRDTLEDKHYCATQIQKIARGYLATMRVYEDLYNITVVQSIARRRAAIKVSKDRYRSICTIQALWRGLQCRRELSYLHWSAVKVQSVWRGYTAKLNYQFDIVDIIIVQSVVRRRAAMNLAKHMSTDRNYNAATTIQKYWRSYDCTMNYLHSVADILIAQSVVRRWIAQRYVKEYRVSLHYEMTMRIQMCVRSWQARTRVKKQRAARDIQKVWRGFWSYTDYVFTLTDIITVQKLIRGHQARKRAIELSDQRTKEREHNAVVTIQKTWRGYTAQMEMLFTLVHIIIVQSVVRRRIARIRFKPRLTEYRAAIKIQKNWNIYIHKRNFMLNYCATKIQTILRRHNAIILRERMHSARAIQAWYRCQATRRGYTYYISARKIQTAWRGYDARNLANEERWVREFAAITIQKTWRRFYQYSNYAIYIHEAKAATDIQRHWRGFWDYSHFVIMRYEACKIQAVVRGVQQRKRLHQQHVAASIIQAFARGILAKKTCHMERLFSAMIYSAQIALRQKIAARKIQRSFRHFTVRVKEKRAALVIERFFIWVRAEVEREIERRERARIKKRQMQRRMKKKEDDDLLENVYNAVNTRNTSNINVKVKSHRQLKSSLKDVSQRRSESAQKNGRISDLAVDVDDAGSDVSGLTTPTITSPRFKLKNKGYHEKLDDDLEGAWHEAKRKQGSSRPYSGGSQKENSSIYTPNLKLSARSLSRNREELRRARVP